MECCPKIVDYGSFEYNQAVQLRYRLFYEEHGISMALVLTERETASTHFVISTQENEVLAYGQLSKKNDDEYQIFQMVVEPSYQGEGLGSRVLQALIGYANREKEHLLTLSARCMQVGFYEKSGFIAVGAVFPSIATGVPHIKMMRDRRK